MPFRFSDLQRIAKLITNQAVDWRIEAEQQQIIWDQGFYSAMQGTGITVVQAGNSIADIEAPYLIYLGKSNQVVKGYQKVRFHYICNQDGSMRWCYPAKLRKATFLNFYCATTLKAKLMKSALQVCHHLHLNHWMNDGSFDLYYKEPLFIEQLLKPIRYEGYSVFMGTIGPNRKMLIELNYRGKTTHFLKWGLQDNSKRLVASEMRTLRQLQGLGLRYMRTPVGHWFEEMDLGLVDNIATEQAIQSDRFQPAHFNALGELYQRTSQSVCWKDSSIYAKVATQLAELPQQAHAYRVAPLLKALHQLKDQISPKLNVTMAIAHGDFTPWNMFVTQDKLAVFDWELTLPQAPLLYDAFHFIFQATVMLKNGGWEEIKSAIEALERSPAVSELQQRYSLNISHYLKLYLLINMSYYLTIYAQQEELHPQAYRLLNVWGVALRDLLNSHSFEENCKENFQKDFLHKVNKLEHVLLKSAKGKQTLSQDTDIDLLVSKQALASIVSFTKQHPNVKKVVENKQSYMTTLSIFFHDHSFLSLDLLLKFRRKGIDYLDAEKLLQSASSRPQGMGFKTPSLSYDFEYTWLFYLLNYSDLPTHYQHAFASLPIKQQEKIRHYLNSHYQLQLPQLSDSFQYTISLRKQVLSAIKQQKANRGWKSLYFILLYFMDVFSQRKGMVVTVNGVDGVGKSTIIEQLKNTLTQKYRKPVVVLRHRPSILPILSAWKYGAKKAEERSMQQLPHAGNNSNFLSSLARFAYYYLDYFLGQFYVHLHYVMRGKIVIYDRYYFDFINDPRRSNISLPTWLSKSLFRYLMKPKLNVFLYADAQEVYRRKQEVSKPKIKALTEGYLKLFNSFGKRYRKSVYLSIENIDQQQTVDRILHTYTKLA